MGDPSTLLAGQQRNPRRTAANPGKTQVNTTHNVLHNKHVDMEGTVLKSTEGGEGFKPFEEQASSIARGYGCVGLASPPPPHTHTTSPHPRPRGLR